MIDIRTALKSGLAGKTDRHCNKRKIDRPFKVDRQGVTSIPAEFTLMGIDRWPTPGRPYVCAPGECDDVLSEFYLSVASLNGHGSGD